MLSFMQLLNTKYYSSAMFALHQINAYEENGYLIMDMCCGDDGNVIGEFTLENLKASGEELDKVMLSQSIGCQMMMMLILQCVAFTVFQFTAYKLTTAVCAASKREGR